ncbi:hypothetical protein LWC08_03755 [Desulfobaculum bizertense]|uniref:hypothetical protein n=1 Tax=Desulfobaculum bizertense TaxID=376490 RepID=UPI001F3C90EF|nr:hypothetical protein [Desulfobaculum bizertense]UIJ38694.1 hypothetical protein LWC08_03755 [Desulfobaculum bizertense]
MIDSPAVSRYSLFRLKIIPTKHQDFTTLFSFEVNKGQLLKRLISSAPIGNVKKNQRWAVAKDIDSDLNTHCISFQFGRIRKKIKSKFDDENLTFSKAVIDDTEYTNCIYFEKLQLLAIKHSTGITAKVTTIAKSLCTLISKQTQENCDLTNNEASLLKMSKIVAPEIQNSVSFIKELKNAYKISKFKIEIGIPNPPDYKSLIEEPLEALTKGGNSLSTTVKASNNYKGLKADFFADIAKGAAISNNHVTAHIHYSEKDQKGHSISIRQNEEPAFIDIQDEGLTLNVVANKIITFFKNIAPSNNSNPL